MPSITGGNQFEDGYDSEETEEKQSMTVDEKFRYMMSKTVEISLSPAVSRNLSDALYVHNELGENHISKLDAMNIYRIVKLCMDGKFTMDMRL